MPIDVRLLNSTAQVENINDLNNIDNFAINNEIQKQINEPQTQEQVIQEEFSNSQIAKAAWERENELGSYIARMDSGFMFDNEVDDPNFDIADFIENEVNNTKYAPYAENFVQFKNRNNAQLYKMHLDREFRNTEILENSGWKGIGYGIGVSLLSPINAIPVGGIAYKAYKSRKLIKGVALTGLAGGVSVAGTEALLQLSQETRTPEESIINIGAGTILAGTLGGASALLSKRQFNKLAKAVEKDIQTETAEIKINPETQNLELNIKDENKNILKEYEPIKKQYEEVYKPSLIAKNEKPLPFKDYLKKQTELTPTIITDIAKLAKVDKLTNKIKIINNLNPIQRLTRVEYANSPKLFAEKLMKTGMYTNKNSLGIANFQSAEINKKAMLAGYNNFYKVDENKTYGAFKKRVKEKGGSEFDVNIKNDVQFFEEVSRAARNNDESPIPEVDALAKSARTHVLNKLGQEAVNVNILNEKQFTTSPKTAKSYFPRLFNKNKVIARENELRSILTDKIKNVLLPQIKEAELNKEKILNSRILDLQTRKLELQDSLDKASEKKMAEAQQDAVLNDPTIPQEYKYIFQNNINRAKTKNESLNLFADNLSNELPDSVVYTYDEIEKLYNKYVIGDDLVYSTDELIELLDKYKTANKTFKNIKLKSLFTKIKEIGGINDSGGDLKAMGITNKTLPGLIRKTPVYGESGLFGPTKKTNFTGADDVALVLWEEGYFPEFPRDGSGGQPSSNDLFELMSKEAHGNKIYSSFDIDKIQQKEAAEELINELEQLGIDFDKIVESVKIKKGKIKKEIINSLDGKKIDTKAIYKIDKTLAKSEIDLLDKKINSLKKQYTDKQVEIRSKFGEIGDENDYINEIVSDIVAKLKGEDRLGLVNDTDIKIDKRGPLKERTLNFVSDNELEPWLENDARKVLNFYANTMATDIEIARAFDGDLTLSNAVEEISSEYDDIIKNVKTEDELKKINKEKRIAINDLTSVAKIMRGFYAVPENPDSILIKGGRIARTYNYITKMGQVALTSVSDIARPIAKHGVKRWVKIFPQLLTNLEGIKLNTKELKLAGNAFDRVAPERMASFSSLHDPYTNIGTFEKYINNVSSVMTKFNLMPIWNDFQKNFTSVISQQRIIENINKYEKLKTNEISYLSQIGIGKDDIAGFKDQIKRFSYKEDGLFIANTEKWDNKDLVRKYYNALNTDVDSTIITMGAGSLPLAANTEIGKVIFQFRSFAFAATQDALMAGLQQKDLAVISGLTSAVSLGAMIYYIRRKMAGKELSTDPYVWYKEGLDRSGFLGIVGDFSNILEKAGVGVSSMLGKEQSSRYAARDTASSVFGPSMSLINDGFITSRALINQDISPSDAKAIRRMIPLNNTFILTSTMDKFEENLTNTE